MTILQSGIAQAAAGGGGYQIARSLRFNSADSANLSRTPGTAGNRKTATWSGWVKRSKLGVTQGIFECYAGASGLTSFYFNSDDSIHVQIYLTGSGYNSVWNTSAVFRDVGAPYHLQLDLDTTQASSANYVKIYVNGVQQSTTLTNYGSAIPQNTDTFINSTNVHYLGRKEGANYLDGYMTEINFIDGQALAPSSFGQTDSATGVWSPIAYTGTYGTNGFYVNFSDNSDTTSTTLGKDYSGNGNNWTPNNFSVTAGVGNDSLVDTPTNYGTDTGVGGEVRGNYATWNNLSASGATVTNGNLDIAVANNGLLTPTTFFPTTGKWYCEIVQNSGANPRIGVTNTAGVGANLGSTANSWAYLYDGRLFHNNAVGNNTGISVSTGDVLMMALDLDAGYLWYGKNGVWMPQTSGGSVGVPSTGSNPTQSFTANQAMSFAVSSGGGTPAWTANFGQRPFAYTAPSGFKALCTQNLSTPAIGATSSTLASKNMNIALYTGNGSTQSITGLGLSPDLVWYKDRSAASSNGLFDRIRGATAYLSSDSTGAESTVSGVTSFDSDGFSLGSNAGGNFSGRSYVGWTWKGGGTAVTNTAGTISSQVSANPTAGFSIVTYTIPSASATIETFGHGLNAPPSMVIFKVRNGVDDWTVYNVNITNPLNNWMTLNTTAAAGGGTSTFSSSSTTFGVRGTRLLSSGTSGNIVAYCFTEISGFSKFGSYIGNGSSDGPFVYCGFRPRYVLIRNTNGGSWEQYDTARDPYNQASLILEPNSAGAQATAAGYVLDILSNGFKLRGTGSGINTNGNTFIYMAFAESPFNYSRAR